MFEGTVVRCERPLHSAPSTRCLSSSRPQRETDGRGDDEFLVTLLVEGLAPFFGLTAVRRHHLRRSIYGLGACSRLSPALLR